MAAPWREYSALHVKGQRGEDRDWGNTVRNSTVLRFTKVILENGSLYGLVWLRYSYIELHDNVKK